MSSNYECIVTIDDIKHTIYINKAINCVTFDDIYQNIRKLSSKVDISYETHVFEIFDFNTNSFKRLTSFKQIIAYLSRIRVLAKTQSTSNTSNTFDRFERQSNETLLRNDLKNEKKFEIIGPKGRSGRRNRFKTEDNNKGIIPFDSAIGFGPQSTQQSVINPIDSTFGQTLAVTSGQTQRTYCPKVVDYSDNKRFNRNNNFGPNLSRNIKPIANPSIASVRSVPVELFRSEGLVIRGDKSYCQLCEQLIPSFAESYQHIKDVKHMRIRTEMSYKVIDKQFMTELVDKNDLKLIISRKIESKKINENLKRQIIGHGIRLNDGFGAQCYVCLSCRLGFADSQQVLNHFEQFERLNQFNSDKHKNSFDAPIDPQIIIELAKEGIEYCRRNKKSNLFKCRLCDIWINSLIQTEAHIRTEDHKQKKTFKGIDRLIVVDINDENSGLLMARKKALHNLGNKMKENALAHGLKVCDGNGSKAYVCTNCHLFCTSTDAAKRHLNQFNDLRKVSKTAIEWNAFYYQNRQQMDILMKEEGIETSLNPMNGSNSCYYCLFCNFRYNHLELVFEHLNGEIHRMVKRGDYIQPFDEIFVVKTERINEFNVCFARMQILYCLDNKTKQQLSVDGIRLKDGIGSNAYQCYKCQQFIGADALDSGIASIMAHVSSDRHRRS